VLSVVTFMWPQGESLLKTHSDTIYCDSIWGVEQTGSKLATIVVIDCDNKIRLAASAMMLSESASAWGLFFKWVKECVPSFCPKCIVTDGASFIFSEFQKAINPSKVTHITCWWHKKNTLTKKYGGGTFTKGLTGVTYTEIEMLQERFSELNDMVERSRHSLPRKQIEEKYKEIQRCFENALVNLKEFTGGTVTNSYAESVNNRLRQAGLTAGNGKTMFRAILILRGYCKYTQDKVTNLSPAVQRRIQQVFQEDVISCVSNCVLKEQHQLMNDAPNTCQIVAEEKDVVAVAEDVTIHIQKNWAITRKAITRVTWKQDQDYVHCSCNKLVYGGMPCIHIIHVALERGKKIPLFCFNKRFFCPKPLPLPEEVAEPLLLPEVPDQLQQETEEAAAASASPAAELAHEDSLGPQPVRLAEVADGTLIPLSTLDNTSMGR